MGSDLHSEPPASPPGGHTTETVAIAEVRDTSGVGFGTSGVRSLVTHLTDRVCYAYTLAFLGHLKAAGELKAGGSVGIGGDLRPSTDRIMAAVAQAVTDSGFSPLHFGKVASPALAYYGITNGIPTIMVTGSHIPADRNGIKFTKPSGEISKTDETGILSQTIALPTDSFDETGMFVAPHALPEGSGEAWKLYRQRYSDFFPAGFLSGKKIGVYQHSAVIRYVMPEILEGLGAEVTKLGFSETFLPVDTEAIREEDVRLGREWAAQTELDCIVSADGDSDRPLISDESGEWLRGDVAGILCAGYLGADSVSTPVSSNTAVERSGFFKQVDRTKIGSPYVIASMEQALRDGYKRVVGYEANGGFLIESPLEMNSKTLAPLPTRDAMILQLSILGLSMGQGKPISALVKELPQRFTFSDRLQEFPTEKSKAILGQLSSGDEASDRAKIEAAFGDLVGPLDTVDTTDGLRMTFGPDILHLRPSGNAPEFRCYTEAGTPERAEELNRKVMDKLRGWPA